MSSASRLETSSIASRPNAPAAMNAIFCATASCLPTAWPHCTRSEANSRAAFVAHFAGPTQIGGERQPAGVERGQRDLQPLALLADDVLARDEDVVEQGDGVLDPAQPHERVAVLDGDARRVVGQDERGDAAAAAVGLRDLRHHDDDVGDRAVGRPQLEPVEQVARAVLGRGGRGGEPGGVGADVGLGQQERGDVVACATSGSHLRFCSSEPNSISGSATPIDWCAESSVEIDACQSRRAPARGCSRPARGRGRRTLGHLHPERAELLEPVEHALGDPRVALDLERVDLGLEERAEPREERLARSTAAASSRGWGG